MSGDILLFALLVGAAAGCLYMLIAARLVLAFARVRPAIGQASPAVTVLKPLHGDEPHLSENLASFCRQDYGGPVQIVFGVARADDPALHAVERLKAEFPGKTLDLVVDAQTAGSNPKVSNLVNMSARIAHDIVVIADSDICVPRDYLARVVGALERAGRGAVTCPYYGISNGNPWSDLSRLAIDGHFLPGVVVGAQFDLGRPCLGSTIALSRGSLIAIGGFEAVADCLADDHALGEALARRGEPVTVLPVAVGHLCSEASLRELWRHELRWAMTIRGIDPLGYCGWSINHALPLSLIALALGGGWPAGLLTLAAIASRIWLLSAVARAFSLTPHAYWLVPLRDLLSFATFVAGFFARDLSWRGHGYRLMAEGHLMAQRRQPQP
jgi:ceramide glucosyltransferase